MRRVILAAKVTIMNTQFDQVAADAMKLPVRDRVRLAQQLVSTLDDEPETDVEELWFVEAKRRLEELHTGKIKGIDADEAFRMAREDFAQ
jgi:putative addiction module component (TIGR02574 family)